MLPKPLTEDICSLRSDVDRLAFSVIWEMTPDIQTLSVQFTKSVIRCASLNYQNPLSQMIPVLHKPGAP